MTDFSGDFDFTRKHTVNVRVEYEPAPIRAIAYQCPNCGNWFSDVDIYDKEKEIPRYEYQITEAHLTCPICQTYFGAKWYGEDDDFNIEEVGEGGAEKGVKRKTIKWE